MQDTLFTVGPDHLTQLGTERSVDFFRDLLFAEAQRLALSLHLVEVPSEIHTPDGGIDASVEATPALLESGIIFPATTKYQIKAGDYSLGERDKRQELLFSGGVLKPRIKACFDAGGTFAVVLLANDSPNAEDWMAKIREELPDEYKEAKIKIIQQGNLVAALKPFLALSLRVNGRSGAAFFTRKEWMQHEQDMIYSLQLGEPQTKLLEQLMASLLSEDVAPIRIIGDAGIGKTRIVFEATKDERISPLVLYTTAENLLRETSFLEMLKRPECDFHAILVVDECDYDDANSVWKYARPHAGKIRLVTISNDGVAAASEDWRKWAVEGLANDQIAAILNKTYGMPERNAERWAALCEGYPRFAHLVGQGVRDNPENLNKSPDIEQAINKMIAGRDDEGSQNFERRKKVLMYLSLFMRFGFGGPFKKDTEVIVELMHEADPAITQTECARYIKELKDLKLIQGRYTHLITPKILHLRLWHEWWRLHAATFNLEQFVQRLSSELEKWFVEMFRYAAGSEQTEGLAKELMAEGGPCDKDFFFKNQHLVEFFRILTPLSPHSAMRILQKRLGRMSKDELLELHQGRREIIYSLSDIAVQGELFLDAARMLLQLADAENETWANNATGVFADLFTPVTGEYAPSELGLIERLPILEEALKSESKNKRMAAIKAIDTSLECQMFSRVVPVHDNVFEKPVKRWMPATYGDLWNAYKAVWNLAVSYLDKLPDEEKPELAKVLLHNSLGVGRINTISPLVVQTLEELAQKPYVGKKPVVEKIAWFLRYGTKEVKDEAIVKLWRDLQGKLMDSSYSGRMQRFVGMNLLEDIFDDDGDRTDKNQEEIEKLADESLSNPQLLQKELPLLVQHGTDNASVFGYQLGKKDTGLTVLPMIESSFAGADASSDLLCGYLRALNQREPKKVAALIEAYSSDERIKTRLAEIVYRADVLTDASAKLVLSLAQEGAIKIADFRLFAFGKVTANLKEETILQWLQWLIEQSGLVSIANAVDIIWAYYLRDDTKRPLPKEITERALTDARWLNVPDSKEIDKSFLGGIWAEVAKTFVEQYPENIEAVARFVLHNLGRENTLFDGYDSDGLEALDEAVKVNPGKVWQLVRDELDADDDVSSHPYYIRNWLKGGDLRRHGPGLVHMNPDDVFGWVDENPEDRAPQLAYFVPKVLSGPESKNFSWARELLVRYGDKQRVRSALHGSFGTEGWSGPASLHYDSKLKRHVQKKDAETNPNVIQWLNEEIEGLDAQIEDAKIREEREGF